jgi:hypothetical protein
MIRKIALTSALVLGLCAQQLSLDTILGKLSVEDDLSKKTIKESAGSVIVFTREDLDRMQIKSLAEIIERIPFLRYNENDLGLIDPSYQPFQPSNANFIKLYVDDREVVDGMGAGGLQLFSQMDLGYIDHIEVYFGAVSFTIGIEPSLAIIKLYTKEPERENANILNVSYATYGTKDVNFYSAQELEDYSYLIYADSKIVKRKKVYYNGVALSRDKHISMLYGKLEKGAIRAEFNLLNGGYDGFISKTLSLEPKDPASYLQNIYAGLYYDDDELKAFVNFSYYNIHSRSASDKLQGILPLDRFPYIYFYNSMYHHIHEMVIDSELSKRFRYGSWDLLFGLKGRMRNNEFLKSLYGDRDFSKKRYTGDKTLTFMFEGSYLLDQSNIFFLSAKRDAIYESGIDNYMRNSFRLGYVHNTPQYTFKLFGFDTAFVPQPVLFIEMEMWGQLDKRLDKERARVIAAELKKKEEDSWYSIMYNRAYYKNYIIRDLKTREVRNVDTTQKIDSILAQYEKRFDTFDKFVLRGYVSHVDYNTGTNTYRGGDASFYKRIGEKLDLYTSLVYRDGFGDLKAGYDFHMALTYNYDKKLSFYVKGINLLKKALKTDYYGYDFATSEVLKLPDVDVIDRTIWIGMEYQF